MPCPHRINYSESRAAPMIDCSLPSRSSDGKPTEEHYQTRHQNVRCRTPEHLTSRAIGAASILSLTSGGNLMEERFQLSTTDDKRFCDRVDRSHHLSTSYNPAPRET